MGRLETINILYLISFLDLFSVGLTFPVFSAYLRDLGVSHTTIGLLISSYSAIQVLSGPLVGSWSDVRGRKTVLRITLFLSSLYYLFLCTTNSIGFIFCLRILLGIVKHTQSICKAMITDLYPNEQKEIFAKSASIASFGFIVGPLVGGTVLEINNGFNYLCFFTSILFVINSGLTYYLPDDSKQKTVQNNSSGWLALTTEFKKSITEIKEVDWSQHWDTFVLKFLLGLTMTCYFSNQAVFLKETYNLSQKYISYMLSFFSTIGIFSGFVLKQIDSILSSDIYTRMCIWYGVLALCFIGLSLSTWIVIFLLIMVPLSLAATAMRVTTMDLMFQKSEALHRGSLAGTSNSVMSVARFVTPLLTGVTSDIFTEKSVMLIAVVPAALGLFVSLFVKRKQKNIVKNK